MIRFILACLSIGFIYSCNDTSFVEDFGQRGQLESVVVYPDTLEFDSSSLPQETVQLTLIGQLNQDVDTYLPQVIVERGGEIISSPSGITEDVSANQFQLIIDVQIDTRSNSPLLLTSYIEYENGESSDFFLSNVTVKSDLGSAPVIDSVAFPSEVTKPANGAIPVVFNAYVKDDDGLDNIEIVTMSLFDDQGNAVGSPLQLYDDGSQTDLGNGVVSGDLVRNDGNFTRTLQIENSNTARTLTLRFLARDKTGQESNVIESTFTILEP